MNPTEQPPEQLRYALVLEWGSRLGLGILLVTFAAYLSGLVETQVAVARLPEVWGQPVARYLELTGTPSGWGWLGLIAKGDIAALAGIVLLAGTSIACLLAVLPLYAARRDRLFVVLCLANALVLAAAAGWSGATR